MAIMSRTLTANNRTQVSLSPLDRLAGPLALAAGSLFTCTQLMAFAIIATTDRTDPYWMEVTLTNPAFLVNSVLQFLAFCLLAIALVAAYGWQAKSTGILGTISVVMALVGTMSIAGDAWFEAFVVPWLAAIAPEVLTKEPSGMLPIAAYISFVLFALGWILFGIASLRARVFPRAISIAIMVGGLAGCAALAVPPTGAILGLAVASLGVWLQKTTPVSSQMSAPTTV